MVERRQTKRLMYVALFLGLAALVTFLRLLPVGGYGVGPGVEDADDLAIGFSLRDLPAPDVLLCLTLAWVVRRPDLLPAPVIAGYFLLEDILLLRPPGLWAALVLLGSEWLRGRVDRFRANTFWMEYLIVAMLMFAMFLVNRAVLAIVMTPQVPLDLSFLHFLATVAAYPLVVAVSHYVFGLRKPATGEVDALGQRL
ncbi:MAG: rod shape-determining protein MreD [Rhodobacteraceae bacterium]|nr:MAG: rod shape-determining protein MreD [Paracoccaceae bacterium]